MQSADRSGSTILFSELDFHVQSLKQNVDYLVACDPASPEEKLFKVEKEMPISGGAPKRKRTMVLFVRLPAAFPTAPPVVTSFGGFEIIRYSTATNNNANANTTNGGTVHLTREWRPEVATLGEEAILAFAQLDKLWGPTVSPIMKYDSLRSLAAKVAEEARRAGGGSSVATNGFSKYTDLVDNPAAALELLLREDKETQQIKAATDATLDNLTNLLAKLDAKQQLLQDARLHLLRKLENAGLTTSLLSPTSTAESEGGGGGTVCPSVDVWVQERLLVGLNGTTPAGTNLPSPTSSTPPASERSPTSSRGALSPTTISTLPASTAAAVALGRHDGLIRALKEEARLAAVEADDAKKTFGNCTSLCASAGDLSSGGGGDIEARREFERLLGGVFEKSKAAHLIDLKRKVAASLKL